MAYRRSYNPNRITMTERLAFNLCGDPKKKVRAIRQRNEGLLPWQRQLIVTTFAHKYAPKEFKPLILPKKLLVGDIVNHSAGGTGKVTKLGIKEAGLWINFNPKNSDNFFPANQICRFCKMIFPTPLVHELHVSTGHKKEYPYIGLKTEKPKHAEVENWERRTVAQYDKDDNRFFVQTQE